jgi:riboflavin kinase
MRELKILLYLGKKGALEKEIPVTTIQLARDLKIPQQTVSRILIGMMKKKLIEGKKGIKGYLIRITRKGSELLQDLDSTLDEILKRSKEIIIHGKVVDGLKDGKYYLSQKEYIKSIRDKLGFEPYPGTLNLRLNDESIKERLNRMNGIRIEGFEKDGRIFGPIKCFKCKIKNIDASVIIPERSHYGSEILELISPFELRKKLKLKNGEEVVVHVERNESL